MDSHTKATMEGPDSDGSISFLNTKCPNSDYTMHTVEYRKPTNTDCYQDWKSNHPISSKKRSSLIYRAKNFYSPPEISTKEINYLHRVLFKNSYPDWINKYSKMKPTTPNINTDAGLEGNKISSSLFTMFLASVRN